MPCNVYSHADGASRGGGVLSENLGRRTIADHDEDGVMRGFDIVGDGRWAACRCVEQSRVE